MTDLRASGIPQESLRGWPPDQLGGTPLVSVLVTARNEERWIGRALRSVQRQTFQDFEVIVVDDGSTDRTAAVVQHFAAGDARIRLVVNPGPHGAAAASNLGLDHCNGEFVARLDADDVALRRRLELQVRELRANPDAVAVGTYGLRVNELGLVVGRLKNGPGSRKEALARRRRGYVNITHSSAMFRRDALERVGRYPVDFVVSEDGALFSRLLRLGEVYAIPRILTIQTLRRGSLSASRLFECELINKRLKAEATRGTRYASMDDFIEQMKFSGEWDAMRSDLERVAARRAFGRALANVQLIAAARIARHHGFGWDLVLGNVQRCLTGR